MREGNSSYDKPGSSYNPNKSYTVASWQDYIDWMKRFGFTDIQYDTKLGISCRTPWGRPKSFKTKKEIFVYLMESNGEKYV